MLYHLFELVIILFFIYAFISTFRKPSSTNNSNFFDKIFNYGKLGVPTITTTNIASTGDPYYDFREILCYSGDSYYDCKGHLRSPVDCYYDFKGILRIPGKCYYDYKGYLRYYGDSYYDSKGYLRSPK